MRKFIQEFFRDLVERIKIDWQEYRGYKASMRNVKRDKKQINQAIRRAQELNSVNGRTYYILRDLTGNINEVSPNGLKKLRLAKQVYFPKYKNIADLYEECFAIVTSNETKRNSYLETVNNMKKREERDLKDSLNTNDK